MTGIFRKTGYVKRLHTVTTLTEQDLSQHQWHVARIYVECFHTEEEDSRGIMLALFHDRGEYRLGDIPAPPKRWIEEQGVNLEEIEALEADRIFQLPEPSAKQQARVKFCDSWELVEHTLYEMAMGNTLIRDIHDRALEYAMEHFKKLDHHDRTCVALYIHANYPQYRVEIDD